MSACVYESAQESTDDTSYEGTVMPSIQTKPIFPTQEATTAGEPVAFGTVGSTRMTYSTAVSSVRYVTSAAQLPQNEALAAYDDAYFATGALLLVMETVSSSVQVGIESITALNGTASVKLSHAQPGENTNPTITVWLIWVEVEQGLNYQWTVENPAMDSTAEKY